MVSGLNVQGWSDTNGNLALLRNRLSRTGVTMPGPKQCGRETAQLLLGHNGVYDVAFSPMAGSSRRRASTAWRGSITDPAARWSARRPRGPDLLRPPGHRDRCGFPSNRRAGDGERRRDGCELWDTERRASARHPHPGKLADVAFSPDGGVWARHRTAGFASGTSQAAAGLGHRSRYR